MCWLGMQCQLISELARLLGSHRWVPFAGMVSCITQVAVVQAAVTVLRSDRYRGVDSAVRTVGPGVEANLAELINSMLLLDNSIKTEPSQPPDAESAAAN